MNKAFVREPDEPDDVRCPSCQAIGLPVGPATVRGQLAADGIIELSDTAFYCASPRCDVGYFDSIGRTVPASAIRRPIHPKHQAAPVCLCLNLSADDVIDDARRADASRVRQAIAHCRATPERCMKQSPSERTCEAEIQQLYLKHLKR